VNKSVSTQHSETTPRVTVLMCVYNAERYLRQAIESILNQTFCDFEFLIVNDGSTDGSRHIIRSYDDPRIRCIDNAANIGLTRSLNRGLASSRGGLIARQDADDVSHPLRLERQMAFMDAHAEVALLGTQARLIDKNGRFIACDSICRPQSELGVRWSLLFGNPFVHSSVMFRREEIWDHLDGYNESFRFNQDFELWSRVLVQCRARNLPETLVDYRCHPESIAGSRGRDVLASRRQNLEMNKSVQRRNVMRILQFRQLAEQWPDTWTTATVNWVAGEANRPAEVLDLLTEIYARFVQVYPNARASFEVRRIYSEKLVFVAQYLATRDRAAALKAYTQAWRIDRRTTACALPRFLALLCAEEFLVPLIKQIRNCTRSLWSIKSGVKTGVTTGRRT